MASLQPVSPGQAVRFSAGDYNAILDAARAHQERTSLAVGDQSAKLPPGIILVKNNTANDREILEVLAVDAPLILPTDSLKEFRSRVALSCILPGSTHAGRYVVLQEPIPAGKIGRAMVVGVTPALLDVTAESDRFAEVASGVATSLKTGTTGSARILWKESGTGSKRGVVMLTGEQPAAAASPIHEAAANPTVNDDSGDGYIIGTIWVNTTTDAVFVAADVTVGAAVWTSAAAVAPETPNRRMKFISRLTSGTTLTLPTTGGVQDYDEFIFVLIAGGGGGGDDSSLGYGSDLAEYSGGGSAKIGMKGFGGGGGGGETVIIRWCNVDVVTSLTYAIGAAGAASTAGGNTDLTIDGTLVRAYGGAAGAVGVLSSGVAYGGKGGLGGGGNGPGNTASAPTHCIIQRLRGHSGNDGGVLVYFNGTTDIQGLRELASGGSPAYTSDTDGRGGEGASVSGVPQAGYAGCILVFGVE